MITISEIKKLHTNSDNLRLLKETLNIVPFIGAGVSSCCYPMWKDFLLKSFNLKTKEKIELTNILNSGKYEEAASFVSNCVGTTMFNDVVKRTFNPTCINSNQIYDYALLLPSITKELCLTTNLDGLLEKIFADQEKEIRVITPNMQDQMNEAVVSKKRFLVKLHGTQEESTTYVLTKEQYDMAYGLDTQGEVNLSEPTSFVSCLSRYVASKTLLFIGCSLDGDRTLKVLRKLTKLTENKIFHYALLELPDCEEDVIDRERKLLNEYGIRIIWYPKAQYDSIGVILKDLIENLALNDNLPHSNLPKVRDCFLGRESELEHVKKK